MVVLICFLFGKINDGFQLFEHNGGHSRSREVRMSDSELDEDVIASADEACQMGYDRDAGEELVFGRVIDICRLEKEVEENYASSFDPTIGTDDNPVVAVHYETWALPGETFDPGDPDNLVHREESAVFAADTLLKGDVVGYGLGREYGHLDWDQMSERSGPAANLGLPAEAFQDFVDLIRSERIEAIEEYFEQDDDAETPEGLPSEIEKIYEDVRERVRGA